jgi:hypothetical protein
MQNSHTYVIIPYRARGKHADRKPQLDFLIPYMAGYLNGQGLKYSLIVIEQNDDELFNSGKLKNIGVLESKKFFIEGDMNTLVFQNVDIIPKKINYTGYEVGFTNACGYTGGCGSLCFFDIDSFEKVNGFPNNIMGWGGEDSALTQRISEMNIPFHLYSHASDPNYVYDDDTCYRDCSQNDTNRCLAEEDLLTGNWKSNGVSKCEYTVDNMVHNPLTNYYHFWVSW